MPKRLGKKDTTPGMASTQQRESSLRQRAFTFSHMFRGGGGGRGGQGNIFELFIYNSLRIVFILLARSKEEK